jgi:hypothetical protein
VWGFKVSALFEKPFQGSRSYVCVEVLPFSEGKNRVRLCGRCFLKVKRPGTYQKNWHLPGQGECEVLQRNIDACLQKTPWRQLLICALLLVLAVLNSCKGGGGGSSTTTTTPTNLVSCVPSQVNLNGKSVCTATITGLNSTAVGTWEVAGVAGGDATHGTIDNNGNYTAPATFPAANVITITALAQAQTSLTGTANVTILQPTIISSVICQDSGTQALTISSGRSLACTAIASGGSVIPAFWKVNSVTGGAAATGFISQQGVYIAPLVPPTGGTVTITAVSQSDSTQTLSVVVTDTFGNAVLQGPYAFSLGGKFTSPAVANPFFLRAGSFIADGSGRLSGGQEDLNQANGVTNFPFTGTYSIGPDGRGTMQFCEHTTLTCTSSPGVNFRVVVLSPQRVQIIQFETGATANGQIVSQDTSAFNTSGLSGTYTFNFSGVSSGAIVESAVGEFSADGDPGHMGTGKITSGEIDVNNGGSPSTLTISNTSTYSVSASGRGTATLFTPGSGPTFKFNFYMVNAGRAIFIEQDSTPVLAGDVFKQQFGGPWGASTLSGGIVLGAAGGSVTDLLSFTADGAGNIVAGSGTLDQNNAGAVSSASSLGGSYTFDPIGNGRGTLTISGHTYIFYMIAPAPAAVATVQETTAGVVAYGSMMQPQSGPFSGASMKGSYALDLTGLVGTGEEDIVGQLTADGLPNSAGTGKIISGMLDINNFGTLQPVPANTTGTYTYNASVGANGRTTMSLTPSRSLVLYFVSPTQLFVMGTDSTGPANGSQYKQF